MKCQRPTCFFVALLLSQVIISWALNHFPNGNGDAKKDSGGRQNSAKDRSLTAFKSSVDPKLGSELSSIYIEYIQSGDAGYGADLGPSSPSVETYLSVDVVFTDNMDNESAKALLSPLGVQIINCFASMCSVRIPIASLKAISKMDSVLLLQPVKAITNGGSISTEGDVAMFANVARTKYAVNGSGILIGVLSDSFDCLGGAANDVFSGDLPSGIVIVADLNSTQCRARGSDEGRGMMQLIHDVAPGARLAFRTALRGQADFAAGILELAAAGCDVIVDDVVYFFEPMFQDGIVAQAVDQVVSQGIPYFSAAGNQGRASWVAPTGFNSTFCSDGDVCHQFAIGTNGSPITSMRISMRGDSRERFFVLQWGDSYSSNNGGRGSRSDIDVYLYVNGVFLTGGADSNVGKDPVEGFSFVPSTYSSNATVTVDLRIPIYDGPLPSYMKLIVFGEVTSFEFATDSSTLYGHANAAFAAGVGAAFYNETPAFGVSPPLIESGSSSAGGTPILFTKNGTRLSSPEIRNQPRFTGPDGGATTFFGSDFNGIFRFFGTSASVAHVAAVAALVLEFKGGNRSLTPAEIYSILSTTATDMDDPSTVGFDVGFDFGTGSGLVNALAALNSLVPPTAAPSAAPSATPVARSPVAIPVAPTPVSFPIASTPVEYPTATAKHCGLFGMRIFCPFTFCGIFGRLLGICN
jgi:hypothetical protein